MIFPNYSPQKFGEYVIYSPQKYLNYFSNKFGNVKTIRYLCIVTLKQKKMVVLAVIIVVVFLAAIEGVAKDFKK